MIHLLWKEDESIFTNYSWNYLKLVFLFEHVSSVMHFKPIVACLVLLPILPWSSTHLLFFGCREWPTHNTNRFRINTVCLLTKILLILKHDCSEWLISGQKKKKKAINPKYFPIQIFAILVVMLSHKITYSCTVFQFINVS